MARSAMDTRVRFAYGNVLAYSCRPNAGARDLYGVLTTNGGFLQTAD